MMCQKYCVICWIFTLLHLSYFIKLLKRRVEVFKGLLGYFKAFSSDISCPVEFVVTLLLGKVCLLLNLSLYLSLLVDHALTCKLVAIELRSLG